MADTKKTVTAYIAGDATGYKKAMSEAEQHTGKTGAAMQGIFTGIGIAAADLAIDGIKKVGDFLVDSSKVARDAEVTTSRLTTALKDNVKGFTGDASAMEGSIDAGRRLGFTGDSLRASLAKLVTVTHNSKQAQTDATLAQELARARGIDLGTATDIVTKAQLGNIGALKRMGIAIPAVTTAVDDLKASHDKYTPAQLKAAQATDKAATATAALGAITKATAGQAEAYAGTMQGSLAVASVQIEGIQEKLGATLNQLAAAVLPPLIAGLEEVGSWFGQMIAQVQPFVPVVVQLVQEGFAAMSDAFNQIVVAIQPLLPVLKKLAGEYIGMIISAWKTVSAIMINTVVPIIVHIVKAVLPPLTAALKWLADDVIPAASKAFSYVASKVMPLVASAIDWITKNVLPALGAAFDWIVKNIIPPLVTVFGFIANTVLPALGTGLGILTDRIIPALSRAFQNIARVVGGVMGGIGGTVKSVINDIIRGINALIRAIDSVRFNIHIPNPLGGSFDFGFSGVNLPTIPLFHRGGVVPGSPGSDVLAVLQAGERVIPRGAGGASGATVVVNINGGLIDGPTIDVLTNALARRLRFTTGT